MIDLLDATKVYVLTVIEHAGRRVRVLGATAHPVGEWVVQQARHLVVDLQDAGVRAGFLVHDRDASFCAAFDQVLADAGITVIRSAVRAPRMNPMMDRWLRSLRAELTDRALVWNIPRLRRLLCQDETFSNEHRPHRALGQAAPLRPLPLKAIDLEIFRVRRRDRAGASCTNTTTSHRLPAPSAMVNGDGTVWWRRGRAGPQEGATPMFERFATQARRVIVDGQHQARLLNHQYIGTEHLLLALLDTHDAYAATPLGECGITLAAARDQVIDIVKLGEDPVSGNIPFTPRAKKALELAIQEAQQLGHDRIETGHLLLGVLAGGQGIAIRILRKLGAEPGQIRERVVQALAAPPPK